MTALSISKTQAPIRRTSKNTQKVDYISCVRHPSLSVKASHHQMAMRSSTIICWCGKGSSPSCFAPTTPTLHFYSKRVFNADETSKRWKSTRILSLFSLSYLPWYLSFSFFFQLPKSKEIIFYTVLSILLSARSLSDCLYWRPVFSSPANFLYYLFLSYHWSRSPSSKNCSSLLQFKIPAQIPFWFFFLTTSLFSPVTFLRGLLLPNVTSIWQQPVWIRPIRFVALIPALKLFYSKLQRTSPFLLLVSPTAYCRGSIPTVTIDPTLLLSHQVSPRLCSLPSTFHDLSAAPWSPTEMTSFHQT